MSETIEMLVTVKAYPNPSRKYGETVCVAGIRTDVEPHCWVRLWPVQFRDMAFHQRFKKYQFIRLQVEPSSDPRPESLSPIVDSVELGEELSTGKRRDWARRRALVEPMMCASMCELQQRQGEDGTSLGLFRPADVSSFEFEPLATQWDSSKQGLVDQPSFFMPSKTGLEKIPYRFRYTYHCKSPTCRGHRQTIVDWELGQAFRDFRDRYGESDAIGHLRHNWLKRMCDGSRDTAFYAGNQYQAPLAFVVLGTFWPPLG
jgi:hypothetical protein